MRTVDIQRWLKENKVLTVGALYYQRTGKLRQKYALNDPYEWPDKTIFDIIRRKEYLGHTLTGKTTNISALAAEIPRESATSVHLPKANVSLSADRPSCRHVLNATEAQIQITENIIGDILDEVQTGNLGYTLAAGYANARIRKAVMANQTDGNGYSILSPIAQNAIRIMRDRQIRPDAYAQAEAELKILLADLITDVQNGKDYLEAVKEAYIRIYKSADASFNYDEQFSLDTCYRDIPTVENEKFTVARKLLLEAKK